jgi:FKBP-type peptidyl-prolyl cis-trans isomerase SlyD
MQISDGVVAIFHYTLTNDQGEVLDSSAGEDPLSYIHGSGMIIPGLEDELAGKSAGDTFTTTVEPEGAYGDRDEDLVQTISRDEFPPDQELEVGMQFHAQTKEGSQLIAILAIDGEDITIDTNHPLAGERLTFEIEVLEVREATEEERSHGHVHGSNGQH